jgi:hypothetical protein
MAALKKPNVELAACPHCGSSDVYLWWSGRGVFHRYHVQCRSCICRSDRCKTRAAAAARWRAGQVLVWSYDIENGIVRSAGRAQMWLGRPKLYAVDGVLVGGAQ